MESIHWCSSVILLGKAAHPGGLLIAEDADGKVPLSFGGNHNPHIGRATGDTGGADRRLRMPGDKLCDACHGSSY